MDKLSWCLLICSFLYSPLLSFIITILYLFSSILEFNYKSLFLAWFCLFYGLYNFVTMVCITFSSCVLLCCISFYWYNIDNNYLLNIPVVKHNINKLQNMKTKYKTYITNKIIKNTNITQTNLITYEKYSRKYYTFMSNNFDKLCNIIYNFLSKMRELTNDIPGCKNIYYFYDSIFLYINCIELLKPKKNTAMPNMTSTMSPDKNIFEAVSNMSPDKNIFEAVSNMSENKNIFEAVSNMSENNMFNIMSNMSSEEKKQMNNITREFMKNFNINDLMTLPSAKKRN